MISASCLRFSQLTGLICLLPLLAPVPSLKAQGPRNAPPQENPQDPRLVPHMASRKPVKRDLHFFQQRAFPLDRIPAGALMDARREAAEFSRRRTRDVPAPGFGRPGNMEGWIMAGPNPINGGQTSPPSNVSGRITSLSIAPGHSNHWYAGTAQGGVWHTTNWGESWSPLSDAMPSLAIGAVAVAAGNVNVIYAGTGESVTSDSYAGVGVIKSTDGGVSWTLQAESVFRGTAFSEIRVHPGNANIAVATTKGSALGRNAVEVPGAPTTGIFKTSTGGGDIPGAGGTVLPAWTKVFPPAAATSAEATDLEADPFNFANLYAAISGNTATSGVWRSTNTGDTWSMVPGPWLSDSNLNTKMGRIEMAISPADSNAFFVSIQDRTTGGILGQWRTANLTSAAPDWTMLPLPASGSGNSLRQAGTTLWYNHALSVDPEDSRILYFGEVNLWKYDGRPGANPRWTFISAPLHSDHHAMAWTADNAGINHRLVSGNDGGIWFSDNKGTTWTNCNESLALTQFYEGAIHPTLNYWAMGGAQDNGTSLHQGSLNWKFIQAGDGADCAFSPNQPATHWIASSQNQNIYRTRNAGANWIDADGGFGAAGGITDNGDAIDDDNDGDVDRTETNNGPFIARLAVHPANADLVIAGTNNVWKSADFFSANNRPTWSNNGPEEGSGLSALAFATSDNSGQTYAYGTQGGALKITTSGGGGAAYWKDLDPSNQVPGRWVTAVVFDPRNANIIYVSLSGFDQNTPGSPGHLFKTGNALTASPTWINVSAPVNSPHNTMTMDPDLPHVIYAGTDVGIWQGEQKPGDTVEWKHIAEPEGLPNAAVFDLEFHRPTRRLMAFTHGRGMYAADLLPAHDDVGAAEHLVGSSGAKSSSNLRATAEGGEPNHHSVGTGNQSVWYRWVPTIGGNATFSTVGSTFDTVISVYKYDATPDSWNYLDLPPVGSDDDAGGNKTSRLTCNVVAGSTYYIAVDGFTPADSGAISLAWSVEDTQDPAAAVTTPPHNSFVTALTTLSGTASDNGGLDRVEVRLQHGSSYWNGTDWAAAVHTFSRPVVSGYWSLPTLPSGALALTGLYTVTVTAFDLAGRPSPVVNGGSVTSFTVDTAEPTGGIEAPTNGSVITTSTFSFAGNAQDNAGIERVVLFIRRNLDGYYWDGSDWVEDAYQGNLSATFSNGGWSSNFNHPIPGSQMTNGSYNFIAIIFDRAGQSVQRDSQVTVDFHQVYQWTGGTMRDANPNNNSISWGAPDNWSPAGTPDVSDIVVIDNGDRVESTISRTVYGLRLGSGILVFTNGGGPSGTLTTTKTSEWTGGSFYGAWVNNRGAALTISGPGGKDLRDGSVLENEGTVVWAGGAPLSAEGNGYVLNPVINNLGGGRFRLLGSGSVFSRNSGRAGVPVFNNHPNAVLEAVDGTPQLHTFHLNNAGVLEFTGGAVLKLNTVTSFTGAAPLVGTGSLVNEGGAFTVQGDLHTSGPQVVFQAGDIIGHSDGTAAWKVSAGGRIRLHGGRFFNTVAIPSGHRMEIEDAPGSLLGREFRDGFVLNNSGTVNWRGTSPITTEGNGYVANPVFNNKAGGVFNAGGGAVMFSRNSGRAGVPVFNNETGGTFVKTTAAPAVPVLTIDTLVFNNQGALVVESGVLAFNTTVNHQSATPLAGPGTYEFRDGRLGITGPFSVENAAAFLLGGDFVSEAQSASLQASGASRIHLRGGRYWQKFTVPAGSRVEIDDPAAGPLSRIFRDGMVLDNAGTVTWAGGGPIMAQGDGFEPNAVFNNKPGGVFAAAADGVLFSRASGRSGTPVFNNEAAGTFRKPAGSGALVWDTFLLNNAGSLVCEAGLIAFNTTVNHLAAGPLQGPGSFEFRSGRLGISGEFTSATQCYLLGGEIVSEENSASLNASGLARIHLQGGFYFNRFSVPAGQRLEVDDPTSGPVSRQWRDGFILDNRGTVTWAGGSPIMAQGDGFVDNAVFNNQSGGLFVAEGTGPLFTRASFRSGVPVFNNLAGGEFRKGPGAGDLLWDTFHFVNNGALSCRGGRLVFNNTRVAHESLTSLTGPGTYRLAGGNLVVRGRLGVDATQFVMAGGDVSMHADGSALFSAVNAGLFRAQGGRYLGPWTLEAGTRMNFEPGDAGVVEKFFSDGSVFTNQGHVYWNGGGTFQAEGNGFAANPVFVNKAGARFEFAATGAPFSRASGRSGVPVFINEPDAEIICTSPSEIEWHTFHLDQRGEADSGSGGIRYATEMILPAGSRFTGTVAHRFSSGTLRVNGAVTSAEVPFHITGGGVIGSAAASFNATGAGAWHWLGGNLSGVFANRSPFFVADPASGATVKYFTDGSVFSNHASIVWSGAGPIQAEGNGFSPNPIIHNLNGATFSDQATGVFNRASYRDGVPVFNNHGTLNIGPGIGILSMEGWNFTQHASGILNVEMAGPAPAQFDRLSVGYTATLGGALNVSKSGGFTPVADTSFAFLTAAGRSGNFATVNAAGFSIQYATTGASLQAVSTNPVEEWAAALGLNGPDALPDADPDKDGVANLMEYALGMNPKTSSSAGLPEHGITPSKHLQLNFSRRHPSELTYIIENPFLPESERIIARLLPGATAWTGTATVTETGEGSARTVTVQDPTPVGSVDNDFLRLRVVGPQ